MSCPACGSERIHFMRLRRQGGDDTLDAYLSGHVLEGFRTIQQCPYCNAPLPAKLNGVETDLHLEFKPEDPWTGTSP